MRKSTPSNTPHEVIDLLFSLTKEAFKSEDGNLIVEDMGFVDKETGRQFTVNVSITEDKPIYAEMTAGLQGKSKVN